MQINHKFITIDENNSNKTIHIINKINLVNNLNT